MVARLMLFYLLIIIASLIGYLVLGFLFSTFYLYYVEDMDSEKFIFCCTIWPLVAGIEIVSRSFHLLLVIPSRLTKEYLDQYIMNIRFRKYRARETSNRS
jgi:hypothetical protein